MLQFPCQCLELGFGDDRRRGVVGGPHLLGHRLGEVIGQLVSDVSTLVGVMPTSALRPHDADSVRDKRLSIDSARALAQVMRSQLDQVSFDLIVQRLNREGFTTRKRVGRWWGQGVRDLLEGH